MLKSSSFPRRTQSVPRESSPSKKRKAQQAFPPDKGGQGGSPFQHNKEGRGCSTTTEQTKWQKLPAHSQPVIPAKAGIQKEPVFEANPSTSVQKNIGNIPAHWTYQNLSSLCKYSSGRTPARKTVKYWSKGTIPWLSISDMKQGKNVYVTKQKISDYAFKEIFSNKVVPKGTLLMSFKLTIGRTCFAGVDLVHNEAIIAIYPKKPLIDKRYLGFYLPMIDYSFYQDRQIKGNTLNKSKIDKIKIPLPPLEEQKKIAGVLSQIQKAVEIQDKLISATIELKKATMKHLFTYGIQQARAGAVPPNTVKDNQKPPLSPLSGGSATVKQPLSIGEKEAEGFPPDKAKALKAGIQKATALEKTQTLDLKTKSIKASKTTTYNSEQTKWQELPAHWDIKAIEDLFELKQGKSLSAKNQTGLNKKPFLRTSNVFWGYLNMQKVDEMDIPEKDQKTLVLKRGDLLVCEGGDIGRTTIWNNEMTECYYQNHIHRLRAKDKKIFPRFYMYWMDVAVRQLNIYGTFGNRTTIPNLSGKRLLKFKIPVPPLEEQKKIAGILQKIDQKEESHKKKKKTLEELFKTMLHKLMTGQIHLT